MPPGVRSAGRAPWPSATAASSRTAAAFMPVACTALGGTGRPAGPLYRHARRDQSILYPVELVPPVGMRLPERREVGEAGEIAQAGLGGLGHRHLAGLVALHALGGLDPEPLGGLLGE